MIGFWSVLMIKPIDIYLVSSTLHFFWAFMLAKRFEDKRDSHLILIDQYSNRPMQLWRYLTEENTPFVSQNRLEGRELGGWKKLRNRHNQFNWVSEFIKNNNVERVWIGNDRSVLGQWFIKEAKQKCASCVACFMDDGVFSYLGRAASQSFSERYLDAVFKKIIYGFWYDSPLTVGASKWIDQAWVMYPSEVNSLLKNKELIDIYPDNQGFKAFSLLAKEVLKQEKLEPSILNELDVLITLPNETVFTRVNNYKDIVSKLISKLIANKKLVGIKYHPAADNKDILDLSSLGVTLLPSNISFESLIPYLSRCKIVGDLSTTVLIANYSNTLNVEILTFKEYKDSASMRKLSEKLQIPVVDMGSENYFQVFLK